MRGRPSAYSKEIADKLCMGIAEGKSLAELCRTYKLAYSTVIQWLRAHQDFQRDYARAREDQADADADAVGDIAARVLRGELDPQAARVAIDAYKWAAGKRKPKVYGDRVVQEHSGPGGGPIQTVSLTNVSDEELAKLESILNRVSGAASGSAETGS